MAYDGWGFMGFHFFWWLIGIAVIVGFVLWVARAAGQAPRSPQTALEALQRRYANGEITTEEYEKRRGVLERDTRG